MSWPLVVGVGSSHGDDQVGWLILEQLQDRNYPVSRLIRVQHPAVLLDVTNVDSSVIVCDACLSHDIVGAIHHFHWPTDQVIYERPSGSHDMTLTSVMELGRRLDRFPETAEIWAVEGNAWSAGSDPSDEIRAAAVRVAEAILECRCHA